MNPKMVTYLIAIFSCLFISCRAELFMPLLQQKFGPLHNGIRILVANEYLNAQTIWNETAYQLDQITVFIEQTLDTLSRYNPSEHLDSLNSIMAHPNSHYCYKAYEREIAHFNREFITKYDICKETLNIAAAHLEHETLDEINFVRNAAKEIQQVPEACKISKLKISNENHAGIVLCVVARIGQIDQRLLESSQLILDIISEIVSASDMEAESCHVYNELKQQFDEINFSINECLNEEGNGRLRE